jgi:hypothetical protein
MRHADRVIEIQKSYFTLLSDCFRAQNAEVVQAGGDVENGIRKWACGKSHEQVIDTIRHGMEELRDFWRDYYEELRTNLISLDILPVYSISRPRYLRRQLTSAGLYVDTMVCHDDTLSGLANFSFLPPEKMLTLVMNSLFDCVGMLQLQSCFTSNLDIPFAVFCPGERDFDPNIESRMIASSLELVTAYANDLLQTRYSDWEEVELATHKIVGAEAIKKAIKRSEILPAPLREPKNDRDKLSQCFERMRMLQAQALPASPQRPNLKDLLISFMTVLGVIESQLHGSVELDLAPLFPRYAWDLYRWRVQQGNLENARILGWEERQTSAIATGIQHEDLDWLSTIPVEAIIRLRQDGFLEDFRIRLRQVRKRMTLEESSDFSAVAQQAIHDLEAAIEEHVASIQTLEQQARDHLRLKTGNFVGKMSLGIASFWFPPIAIIDLIENTRQYAEEVIKTKRLQASLPDRLRRGPWGMLMEAKSQVTSP